MTRVIYDAMHQRPLPDLYITEIERLASKFRIIASGCWIWQARTVRSGYGRFYVDGRITQAHRLLRHLIFQDAIPGRVVDHLCNNPRCVNPTHLEPVTQAENIKRSPIALATINARKTHCIHGHELAGDNLIRTRETRRKCKACHRITIRKRYYR